MDDHSNEEEEDPQRRRGVHPRDTNDAVDDDAAPQRRENVIRRRLEDPPFFFTNGVLVMNTLQFSHRRAGEMAQQLRNLVPAVARNDPQQDDNVNVEQQNHENTTASHSSSSSSSWAIQNVVISLAPRSPFLTTILEATVFFLRNYGFHHLTATGAAGANRDAAVGLPLLIIRNGGEEIDHSVRFRDEFVSASEQLVEALCLNERIVSCNLRIHTPIALSQRFMHRMITDFSNSARSLTLFVDSPRNSTMGIRILDDGERLAVAFVSSASEGERVLATILTYPETKTYDFRMDHPMMIPVLTTALQTFDWSARELRFFFGANFGRIVIPPLPSGTALFEVVTQKHLPLKRVVFGGFVFKDAEETQEEQPRGGTSRDDAPLLEVIILQCTLGRGSFRTLLTPRPVRDFGLQKCHLATSTDNSSGLLDELRYGMQSLEFLCLRSTSLCLRSVKTLCSILTNNLCNIETLALGGEQTDGVPALAEDCVAFFFDHLELMRLKVLSFDFKVSNLSLAETIVSGVRANNRLMHLIDLSFGLNDSSQEKLLDNQCQFWTRSNRHGRKLVEHRSLAPSGLLAQLLHQCSASNDHEVMYYFVRSRLPDLSLKMLEEKHSSS